jgi:hypothetical protein
LNRNTVEGRVCRDPSLNTCVWEIEGIGKSKTLVEPQGGIVVESAMSAT